MITATLLAITLATQPISTVPEFSLKDTKGKTWTIESLEKDRVYLIEFWATWCATCKEIAPMVDEYVKAHRGPKFEYLAISTDEDMAPLKSWLKEHKPAYPVLLDPNFEAMEKFKVKALPTMFLVKNKSVLWQKTGKIERAELDDLAAKFLSAK